MALDDLDPGALHKFARAIGAGDDIERALRVRGLLIRRNGQEFLTWGAVLMFANDPQRVLPGAFLRILRYEGLRPRPGARSNLVFDRRISGRLPLQIAEAREVMQNQLRQLTRLDERNGQFVTIPEIPEFAWLEAIVNAVTHRSYSLQGDHIRVIIFDDRLEIESPGRLPGPVRIDNIRRTRFSRNPHISRSLADLRFVQELNEGMNRMFEEMVLAGLPEPELHQTDSGFRVILYKVNESERSQVFTIANETPDAFVPALDRLFEEGRLSTSEAARLTGLSLPTVRRYLRSLEGRGLLERVARSPKDPHAYWQPPRPWRGRWRLQDVLEVVRTRKSTRNN